MTTLAASLQVAIHNTVVTELGAGADCALTNAAGTVLAVIPLDTPAGTVNPTSGQLSIAFDGRCEAATASGTAAFAKLRTSTGTALITLPCRSGVSPLSGYVTLKSLSVVAGSPFELDELTFG